MSFTYAIVVVESSKLGSGPASGSFVAELSQTISDGSTQYVASGQIIDPLDVNGSAAICLPSNVAVQPMNTYYMFGLDLGGNTYKPVAGVVPNNDLLTLELGSGAPSSGTGANGSWYFDEVAQVVYGPKAGGAWPTAGISVMGVGSAVPSGVLTLAAIPPALLGAPSISYVLTTSLGQPFGIVQLDGTGNIPEDELANVGGAIATAVATETTRAESAEATLATNLTTEATTRASADTTLAGAISGETTRAETAEATKASTSALTSETTRAEAAEAAAITTAESFATSAVGTETTARIAGDAATLSTAETFATGAVATETTRATTAEATKATTAALTTETTRATTAEGTNATAIATETTRAEAAEATKASTSALTAETARAEAAEALLVPLTEVGANNGVASLDSGGQVPVGELGHIVAAIPSGTYVPILPGVTVGGVVDNWAVIQTYLTSLTLGGAPYRLPPGIIGVASPIQPPEGVTLLGSGSSNSAGGNTFFGTILCPTNAGTPTAVVQLVNPLSGFADLDVTGTNAATSSQATYTVSVEAEGCKWHNALIAGGSTAALHSINAAVQAIASDFFVRGTLIHAGVDWQITNMVLSGLNHSFGGGPNTWTNCHIVNGPPGTSTTALVQDFGDNNFVGCYFDTCLSGAPAMIDRSSATTSSSYVGCRYFQGSTTAISGIPVFLEPTTASAGVVIMGGIGITPSGGSTFTNFVSGAIASTVCMGVTLPASFLSGSFTSAAVPLGVFIGNVVNGSAATVIGGTATFQSAVTFSQNILMSIATTTATTLTLANGAAPIQYLDATSNNIAVSLTFTGSRVYIVKRKDNTANTVTLTPGSGTIEGLASYSLGPSQGVILTLTGTDYKVLAAFGASKSPLVLAAPSQLFATFDRMAAGGTNTLVLPTSGTVLATMLPNPSAILTSNFKWRTGSTAGAGTTGNVHQWAAITDASGNVLAVTGDQLLTALAASTVFTWVWSAATLLPAALLYLHLCVVMNTTMPTFTGVGVGTVDTVPPLTSGLGSTGQTTPPSVGGTLLLPTAIGTGKLYGWGT